VTAWDDLAEHYDRTRGGEERGDEYAADIDERLPRAEGPLLEIGVGTGVVALGLRRRGWPVVGVDLSAPMLVRAFPRLGACLVRADASRLPFGEQSVGHAVSVWVVHAIDDPQTLFTEVARVLRPGGRYVVATTQRPSASDVVGEILDELRRRLDERTLTRRGSEVTGERVVAWAEDAGFVGTVEAISREWTTSPADEMAAITERSWPTALRELDEEVAEQLTRPTLEALAALPDAPVTHRGLAEVVTLQRR
jgi:ubiquinone/menaquinone biosynthesis C-methylase UbiE